MKALIAATKTSEAAACAGWRDMESRSVAHPALGFNLGLYAESEGELDTRLGYHEPLAAAACNTLDVRDSIDRVQRQIAGETEYLDRNGTAGGS